MIFIGLGQKIWFLKVRAPQILIFIGLGTKKIDLICLEIKVFNFIKVQGPTLLIFKSLGTENIDFYKEVLNP